METAISESAKSTYDVLKTAQMDWMRDYAEHLLSLYEMNKTNLSQKSKDYLRTSCNTRKGVQMNTAYNFAKKPKQHPNVEIQKQCTL